MEKLNQYVLMEIFEYLDGKSLKRCAETCSRWAEIIGTSSTTMRKLPLFVDSDRAQKEKMDELKALKRQYHSLIIDEAKMTWNIMTPLKSHMGNIRILELTHIEQTTASWRNMLKTFIAIEKITIVESKTTSNNKKDVDKINIPSLKSLTVIDSDWSYFDLIGETEIEELKIHGRHFYTPDKTSFVSFLKLQKFITSMAIRMNQIMFYKSLLNDSENNINFRLKKLAIMFRHNSDESHVEVMQQLFEQNKSTLESLEIDSKFNDKVYEHIFSKMNLKTLTLNASNLPRSSVIFYNSLQPNKHLKKLVLTNDLSSNTVTQGLFHIYRHVEDLSIFNWTSLVANDVLLCIVNNLTKISRLNIPFLVESAPENAMPFLKELNIGNVSSAEDFRSILLNQNNLEKLSVKWINIDINEVVEQDMIRLNKLLHVIFGPGFKPTDQTLRGLKRNCPDLHTIQVFHDWDSPISDSILSGINGNGLSIYQFKSDGASKIFPTEKGMWYEEERVFNCLSSPPDSDSESSFSDDFDDDNFEFYDSDEDSDFGNPFYFSDSDEMDIEHYMMREVIGMLIRN